MRSSQIVGARFGHCDYIRESISTSNRDQTVWAQVLERDVCLDGKHSSAVGMLNPETYLRVSNHKITRQPVRRAMRFVTPDYAEKASKVTSANKCSKTLLSRDLDR